MNRNKFHRPMAIVVCGIVMTMADIISNVLVTFLTARGARAALAETVLSDQQNFSAYLRLT